MMNNGGKYKSTFNDDLPLRKTLEIYDVTIFVASAFNSENKYYPQLCLRESLYKLPE